MDYQYAPPYPQARPPLHSAHSAGSFSRISIVSDLTDFDNVQPRPSLVSLQSEYDNGGSNHQSHDSGAEGGHVYTGARTGWSALSNLPGLGGGGARNSNYEPVQFSEQLSLNQHQPPPFQRNRHSQGRSFAARAAHLNRRHDTIPEEDGIDLGLLQSAAPLGGSQPPAPAPYLRVEPVFDVSSALGPSTDADDKFIRSLQEQEAQGKLTGGLGAGIRTDAVVTESALLATSPISERGSSMRRSFTRAAARLSRHDTVKKLAQQEANKRGEVIEVVMDDDDISNSAKFDLSVMAGPDPGSKSPYIQMRQTTFPTSKRTEKHVFYPTPDWKPFSMRWPYLLSLIIISVVAAGSVEVLYRRSAKQPLVVFKSPADITPTVYFCVKFLPTLIAVTYGVLWQITNFEVMRLEAFYQLSKEDGSLAAESINVDYFTFFNLFRPIRALHYKHYAVAVSTIASLLANALVPTLCSACIILSPDRDTRLLNPNDEKSISTHHIWSRILTLTLVIIAVFGCILFYQLESRRSGLLADVKGIAGLASMATVSHILMDFKDMDVATHKDIHNKLKNHRYVLRNSALAPADEVYNKPLSKKEQDRERYTGSHLDENPHPLSLRAVGAIPFITFITLFSALIPCVLFTPANVLTDRAPWVITALAVCLKLSWGAMETDVRMMEPYYILSTKRHAPPKTLTLDYRSMPFGGWVALKGAMNGHWLVSFVGFGSVMAEFLTVLVTSLASVEGRVFVDATKEALLLDGRSELQHQARDEGDENDTNSINAGQETPLSFWISLFLADFVLLYMGVIATIVFIRRRRVFLPRQPNTIASVLAYIHQSKMLYDFVGTNKLSNAEMVRKLEDQVGKTYGLGWFQGRDGQVHCGVDEEELLTGYRRGLDYSKATKPWAEGVEWL
ncbi:hypothetical protein QBC32DRAFT_164652 [Pseudoneurospora amorphoporcata]|uniref:Spray n=1 Tax=Pseudoneurospora amorphoporcata TaxID=241081 RepID=A0AAN6P1Q9_9PEZI|nr:hypothetical protein QBC32DRAFT_164652 [Pseudoneurospora amorphoporcata]